MSKPEDNKESETPSFGKWIREQRIARNISLEEIAAVTKVHINQLKHLEEDARDRLPAPAFVRGFLISYARHLGLEEDEVLARFKDTHGPSAAGAPLGKSLRAARSPHQAKVKLVESTPLAAAPGSKNLDAETPRLLKPKNLLAVAGLLLLLIGLGTLISLGKKQKKGATPTAAEAVVPPPAQVAVVENTTPVAAPPSQVPPSAASESSAPSAEAAPSATAAVPSTPAAPKKNVLELKALEQSWVNVRVDDKDSAGMNLAPGATANFEADRKVTLALSDAGAVEIRWNDSWYAPPGFRGDVKSLTLPDHLSKLTARAPKPRKKVTPPATKPDGASPPSDGDAPASTTPAPAKNEPATLED